MSVKFSNWLKSFPTKHYPAKTVIINPGKVPNKVLAIESGVVKMLHYDKDGNSILVSLFSNDCIIPMPAALLGRVNDYIFEAVDDVSVHPIPTVVFIDFLEHNPKTRDEVFQTFLKAFFVLTEQVVALKSNKADEKILLALKQLTCKAEKSDPVSLIQKLSQQDLADLAGVSRETISRRLTKILAKL